MSLAQKDEGYDQMAHENKTRPKKNVASTHLCAEDVICVLSVMENPLSSVTFRFVLLCTGLPVVWLSGWLSMGAVKS